MTRRAVRRWRILRFFLALFLLAVAPAIFSPRARASRRVHPVPHFAAGQVFHYSVQTRIDSTSHSSGPIANSQGPAKLEESISVVLRLEILSVSGSAAAPGPARIRVTYEKAAASSNSDSYDPDIAAMDERYRKLEGQSIEFTLEPSGEITGVTGLKGILAGESGSAVVHQWLGQLTLSASIPKKGIAIGEKWSSAQPIDNVPLAGLVWHTDSTYLRNEPCPAVHSELASGAAPQPLTPAPVPDECAMILTHSVITGAPDQHRSAHDIGHQPDRTPDIFRKNGLRTFGVWTGTGDGLTAVSLRTGMVVSVTQTGATHMDFTIMTATAQNRMRYAGDTHTQSQITLLSQSVIP
jgi:hypothetical protein